MELLYSISVLFFIIAVAIFAHSLFSFWKLQNQFNKLHGDILLEVMKAQRQILEKLTDIEIKLNKK